MCQAPLLIHATLTKVLSVISSYSVLFNPQNIAVSYVVLLAYFIDEETQRAVKLFPRYTQFTSSRLGIQPLSCLMPEPLTTMQPSGAWTHRDHILTLTGCSGVLSKEGICTEDRDFGLRLERRHENSGGDPSHPGLTSFTSVTSFRGAEGGRRRRRGNYLPKLPFPSLFLGLLESNLPQMARAFGVHKV